MGSTRLCRYRWNDYIAHGCYSEADIPAFAQGAVVIIIVFLLFAVAASAQPTWQLLTYEWRAADLHTACIPSATDVLFAGEHGTIVRYDVILQRSEKVRGSRWDAELHGMVITRAGIVVGVGDDGTVVRSADGGTTWSTNVIDRTTNFLCATVMPETGQIMAAGTGGVLYRSLDGVEWGRSTMPSTRPRAIQAAGGHTLFVLDEWGMVYRSDDEGATWQSPVTLKQGIYCTMSARGRSVVIGGVGTMATSDDGGRTFRQDSTFYYLSMTGIGHVSDSVVVATAWRKDVWYPVHLLSRDGGVTWRKSKSFDLLAGPVVVSPDYPRAVICGDDGVYRVARSLTIDDMTFDMSGFGRGPSTNGLPGAGFSRIVARNRERLLCVRGYTDLVRSQDSGITFQPLLSTGGNRILDVAEAGTRTIVCAGDSTWTVKEGNRTYGKSAARLWTSRDDGRTWTVQRWSSSRAASMTVSEHGVVHVAAYGFRLRSDDGGMTFDSLAGPISSMSIATSIPGLLVLAGTSFATSTDDGRTWDTTALPQGMWFANGCTILAGDDIRIVGTHTEPGRYVTAMWKTSDKGKTWTEEWRVPAGWTYFSANGLDASDDRHIAIFGSGPAVAYTADGGRTWRWLSYELQSYYPVATADWADGDHLLVPSGRDIYEVDCSPSASSAPPSPIDDISRSLPSCIPNPAGDHTTITIPGGIRWVAITDMQGVDVRDRTGIDMEAATARLHTRNLPNGVYAVVCGDERGNTHSTRLVILH